MKIQTKITGLAVGCLALTGGGVAVALSPTTHEAAPVAHVTLPMIAALAPPTPVVPVNPAPTTITTPAPIPAPVQAAATPAPVAPAPVTTTTVAPQPAPVAPVPPVASDPAPTPITAPTGAPDGPQPDGPSVTVEQTTCLATWYITTTDPTTGVTSQVEDFYGGDCTEANTLAAEYGGTVTQSTNPVTTTPGEIPGT